MALWWSYRQHFSPLLPSYRNFDEYTIEADHTKRTFWWDFRIFDEYTIEADHTKITFWWTYRQHFSSLDRSLMNLPTALFTPFPQFSEFRWIYHRGRSHKTDIWMDLPTALFTPCSHFDGPTSSTFHNFVILCANLVNLPAVLFNTVSSLASILRILTNLPVVLLTRKWHAIETDQSRWSYPWEKNLEHGQNFEIFGCVENRILNNFFCDVNSESRSTFDIRRSLN